MKWINHQIVTGFIVFAATDNALFVASSIIGAVIPDRVEGSPPQESKKYWKWRKNHRTWSHYPPLYILLIIGVKFVSEYLQEPRLELILNLVIYALFGALLHIIEDGICGKVPIFTPRRKHGIKLFKVGSWQEYVFSAIIISLCLIYRFKEIFLSELNF